MFISYPFSIDERGKIAVAPTARKVWVDRVRAVLSTQVGDRVMRPDFGLDSLSSIFNEGSPAEQSIQAQISDAFTRFLPQLSLVRVRADEDPVSGVTEVDVVFTNPDNSETTTNLSLRDGSYNFNSTD